MITYLKHDEIDKEQWDACIAASYGCKPYAFSWYLDIMSPGWEALVDDDYDSVFPVPARERFGIKYIATPVFLQQLGAFSPDKSAENAIDEFLDYMPEFYRLVDLCIGQKINRDGFSVTVRSNYELDLSPQYNILRENFENSCRHDIDKACRFKFRRAEDIKPKELISLFIKNKEAVASKIKSRDFNRLESLMNFCISTGMGKISGARDSAKNIIFGQFIISIPGQVNILFRVNTPESREKKLNYYFIDEIIREYAGTKTVLDFSGSSIPSIAVFIKSFGAVEHPYYRLYRNSLPIPIRWFK